jgi:hypothetical protein
LPSHPGYQRQRVLNALPKTVTVTGLVISASAAGAVIMIASEPSGEPLSEVGWGSASHRQPPGCEQFLADKDQIDIPDAVRREISQ